MPETMPGNESALGVNRRFMWVSAVTLAVYAAFFLFYGNDALSGPRVAREVFTWFGAVSLGVLFWQGYRLLRKPETDVHAFLKPVLLCFGIFSLLAVLTPNFHSTDVTGYINRGWQQWHYHTNPYVTTIEEIPNWFKDPMISNHWVSNPSPYGFVYMWVAKSLCGLGQFLSQSLGLFSGLSGTILLFKLFNLLVLSVIGWLVYSGLKQTQGEKEAVQGLYLLLWNPLILIHTLMNGHNDIVMGLGIAGVGFLALTGNAQNNRWLWILPVLTLATLVKYAAVILFPFAIVFLLRQKAYRSLVLGSIFSVALFFGFGYPYLKDWQSFKMDAISENLQISHSSIHAFFYFLYRTIAKAIPALTPYKDAAGLPLKMLLLGLYGALMLRWGLNSTGWVPDVRIKGVPILRHLPTYTPTQFVETASFALAGLVCLALFKFYPWYLVLVYPLLLLLPQDHWLKRLFIWYTTAQLLAITVIGQSRMLDCFLMLMLPTILFFWQERRKHNLTGALSG